jgi:hypothetical protein
MVELREHWEDELMKCKGDRDTAMLLVFSLQVIKSLESKFEMEAAAESARLKESRERLYARKAEGN